jgi:hypothetical protein
MQRSEFLEGIYLVATGVSLSGAPGVSKTSIAGVTLPDTALAREANELARSSEPPEIFNHSLRAYLFAELIGKARHVDHDAEAVYVASMLHDTGLTAKYMSAHERFEVDGANLARSLLTRYGVSGVKPDLIWDAIALHDDGGIAKWKGPEVMLVNAGVGADFGAFLNLLARDDVIAVIKEAPRTGFIPVFLDAVAVVARRKPQATGNCFVTDVAYRMVHGFHLENFCDGVKDDPFAEYLH